MADVKITPFLFEAEMLVRVIDRSGAPWFVAKDVCSALGIVWKGSDSTGPLGEMENDEKSVHTVDTPGGPQEMTIISESGLYALIFRSRKPEAKRFRKWVTAEVLPAIRRTGGYGRPAPAPQVEEDEEVQTADGLKLRKVNTAIRCFGERAGAQLWARLGLDMVPAMRPVLAQLDMLEIETVSVTRVREVAP